MDKEKDEHLKNLQSAVYKRIFVKIFKKMFEGGFVEKKLRDINEEFFEKENYLYVLVKKYDPTIKHEIIVKLGQFDNIFNNYEEIQKKKEEIERYERTMDNPDNLQLEDRKEYYEQPEKGILSRVNNYYINFNNVFSISTEDLSSPLVKENEMQIDLKKIHDLYDVYKIAKDNNNAIEAVENTVEAFNTAKEK